MGLIKGWAQFHLTSNPTFISSCNYMNSNLMKVQTGLVFSFPKFKTCCWLLWDNICIIKCYSYHCGKGLKPNLCLCYPQSAFTIADNTNFGLDNSPYNDQRNLCCVPESILSVGADSSYASLVNGRLCINVRFEKYGTNLRTLLVITAVHVEDNDWNLSL